MMSVRTKLFAILWLAGMAGVLSILLIDLSAVLASLPATTASEIPFHPLLVKLLGLIQPTVLLSVAILIGTQLAPAVGLSAPAAEALAGGQRFGSALKRQTIPGVISGFIAGIILLSSWVLLRPSLPPLFVTRAEKLNGSMPLLTRLLYGGITEELLLRWGLLTLIVWAAWRVFQKRRGTPKSIYFVSAILISSVVFGIAHLPLVVALGVDFTLPIVAFVVFGNSLFGLFAGYLFWKKGLEAAIIAHMSTHIVILTAIHLTT
jgi:hypothetical protein